VPVNVPSSFKTTEPGNCPLTYAYRVAFKALKLNELASELILILLGVIHCNGGNVVVVVVVVVVLVVGTGVVGTGVVVVVVGTGVVVVVVVVGAGVVVVLVTVTTGGNGIL
jgi:hypothetical protein